MERALDVLLLRGEAHAALAQADHDADAAALLVERDLRRDVEGRVHLEDRLRAELG